MKISRLLPESIIIIILFVFTLSSFGQSKINKEYKDCSPEEKAKIITDNLKPVLELSEMQYDEIYNIYLDRIRWKSVNENSGYANKSINRKKYNEFKMRVKKVLTKIQQEDLRLYCLSKKK